MATTYIAITSGSRLGQQVQSAAQQLQAAKEQITDLKAIMETMINASDYTMLEQQFGLQAGSGVTLYNLIAGVNTDLSTFNVGALIARVG